MQSAGKDCIEPKVSALWMSAMQLSQSDGLYQIGNLYDRGEDFIDCLIARASSIGCFACPAPANAR